MDNIKNILKQIAINNPNIVGASVAKKITNGFITDDKCLSFRVTKKLPLNELSSEEIIPSEIEVDGTIYKTDIVEAVEFNFMLVCSTPGCYECYDGVNFIPCASNSSSARPIKGGSILQARGGYGTLGFFAIHTPTQGIVGVTNAHVVSQQQAYVNSYSSLYFNNPMFSVNSLSTALPFFVPSSTGFNWSTGTYFARPININKSPAIPFADTIDAAIVGVYQKDNQGNTLITNESWKQIGLSDIPGGINTPPTFASTEELDALLDLPNLEIWSSGARTGIKKTECGLTVLSVNDYSPVGQFLYNNLILIARTDLKCLAIAGGDSGSAVFGKVPTYSSTDPNWKNGTRTWKILGLMFAATQPNDVVNYALACRIDNIAPKLQIEPWDGTSKPFINIDKLNYKSIPGAMLDQIKTIDGKTYYQIGTAINNSTIYQ